jgi:hypothetical protein
MGDHPLAPQARELTPQEQDERARECYALQSQITASLRAGRAAMWALAEALHKFDEANGWTALNYESLRHWLADPEIGMKRATYYRLVGQWRELVVVRQVDVSTVLELDVSKVQVVMPAVKAGRVTLEKALEDVQEMGKADLREVYYGEKDAPVSPERQEDGATADTMEHTAPNWDEPGEYDTPPHEAMTGEVIDGNGREADAPHGVMTVASALTAAEDALGQPQRLAGSRQAVRLALENLMEAVRYERLRTRYEYQ